MLTEVPERISVFDTNYKLDYSPCYSDTMPHHQEPVSFIRMLLRCIFVFSLFFADKIYPVLELTETLSSTVKHETN